MAKINNTDKYPFDVRISPEDFLIGSDSDNFKRTKSYKIDDLTNFFAQSISSKSDSTFFFKQDIPDTEWIVNHMMNKYPTPLILDEFGEVVLTNIEYVDKNVVKIKFGRPTAGSVTLN